MLTLRKMFWQKKNIVKNLILGYSWGFPFLPVKCCFLSFILLVINKILSTKVENLKIGVSGASDVLVPCLRLQMFLQVPVTRNSHDYGFPELGTPDMPTDSRHGSLDPGCNWNQQQDWRRQYLSHLERDSWKITAQLRDQTPFKGNSSNVLP